MFKLKYKATIAFTSVDIGDMADNELITYEIWANRPDDWTNKVLDFFSDGGKSAEIALDIIGLSLVSVSQGGESWPCAGRKNAKKLRDSIEKQSPGYGDIFVRGLVFGIYDKTKSNEDERIKNSAAPLAQSTNGASPEKSLSVAKPVQ